MILRLFAAVLLWIASHVPHGHTLHGRGTVYGPRTDGRYHHPHLACDYPRRRVGQSAEAKRLFGRGHFFASRTLACWTVATVCSVASGRCARAVVADFGPARSLIDLHEVLAAELRHDGGGVSLTPEPAP